MEEEISCASQVWVLTRSVAMCFVSIWPNLLLLAILLDLFAHTYVK